MKLGVICAEITLIFLFDGGGLKKELTGHAVSARSPGQQQENSATKNPTI